MELFLAVAAILGAAYFVKIIGAAFVTTLKKTKSSTLVSSSFPLTIQIKYNRKH
tara:strand:- start:248 stop:409 length:162 start_codon:yes stop_codon:yes gene_type:complete